LHTNLCDSPNLNSKNHTTNPASPLHTAIRDVIVFNLLQCSLLQDRMQLMSTGSESVKAQVVDKIPKRIKELQFGIQYVLRLVPCLYC
jgi:hypothetical protein